MKSKLFKASTQNVFEVEITTVLGCSVDCIYCPQDVLSKSRSGRKPSLTVPDFLSAINNIDLPNVLLSWTGYSEATLHKNFPDFLKLAHQHRFGQVISTTLGGRQDSVLAAINFKNWASFSLHLPDDNGLMRGLDVTPHYLDLLDTAFSVRSEFLAPTKIICFGSNLHPEVKKVVDKHIDLGNFKTKHLKLRGQVSTRCDSITSSKLSETKIKFVNPAAITSNGSIDPFFICDKGKLNQPCLLPDGSLNICSFDYSLSQILGNLIDDKLSVIWEAYKERITDTFLAGDLYPCTKCEHYNRVDPR